MECERAHVLRVVVCERPVCKMYATRCMQRAVFCVWWGQEPVF